MTSENETETLTQMLWNSTKDIRYKVLDTHFLQSIKTGTLDPTYFGKYMIQDCVYCYRVMEAFEVAAEKENSDKELKKFLEKNAENFQRKLANEWQISDPDSITLGEACKMYSEFEKSVAQNEDPIYLVVALIPCTRLWPWIGQQMEGQTHNYGVYTSWFNNNFKPNSKSFQQFENMVDRAADLGHIETEKAEAIYTTCMKGELDFFDSVQPVAGI